MCESNYENVLAWDVAGKGGLVEDSYKPGYQISHATVGVSKAAGILTNTTAIRNSLVYQASGGSSPSTHGLYFPGPAPAGSTNSLGVDPQLKYITRVESASPASGSGQGGRNRGATIVNRYQKGVLTNVPLWPWPNEARIKADFQMDFGLPVNAKRGFAAEGNSLKGTPITLSSYVWEYLGNPCPPGMCN
jgi:hypothetical protein